MKKKKKMLTKIREENRRETEKQKQTCGEDKPE